jgi:hypothetical protein
MNQRLMMRAIGAVIGAGAAIRGILALRTPVINSDGPTFLSIAQGFLSGDLGAATDAGFHTLYPALVALLGGGESVAVIVSAVAGALAGWPFWVLVRDLAGDRAAFLSLIVYELHPSFVDVQSGVFADGVFMLLAACAAAGSIRYARGGRGVWMASIAGALAFLTKSEGLIVLALTGASLGWGFVRRADRGRAFREAAGATLIVAVIAAPYVAHLSRATGRFRISPKVVVEQAMGGGAGRDTGPGQWIERREQYGPLVASTWYLAVALRGLVAPAHLVLVLAAAVSWRKWKDRMAGKAWLGAWFGVYVFCVWWTSFRTGHQISERYLHPPAALVMLMLGAFGAWALEARNGAVREWAARIAGVLLVVVAAVPVIRGQGQDQLVLREAGEWILKDHGPGAVISSVADKVPYYARGKVLPFEAPPPRQADYWVFSDRDAARRGWDWRNSDLGPFRLLTTLPEHPSPGARVVRILGRRAAP